MLPPMTSLGGMLSFASSDLAATRNASLLKAMPRVTIEAFGDGDPGGSSDPVPGLSGYSAELAAEQAAENAMQAEAEEPGAQRQRTEGAAPVPGDTRTKEQKDADALDKIRASIAKAETARDKASEDLEKIKAAIAEANRLEQNKPALLSANNAIVSAYELDPAKSTPEAPVQLAKGTVTKKKKEGLAAGEGDPRYEAAMKYETALEMLKKLSSNAVQLVQAQSKLPGAQSKYDLSIQKVTDENARLTKTQEAQDAARARMAAADLTRTAREQAAAAKKEAVEKRAQETALAKVKGEAQKIKEKAKNYYMRKSASGGQSKGVYTQNPELATDSMFDRWWTERNNFNQEWFIRFLAVKEPIEAAIRNYSGGVGRPAVIKELLKLTNPDGSPMYTAEQLKDTRPTAKEKKAAKKAAREAAVAQAAAAAAAADEAAAAEEARKAAALAEAEASGARLLRERKEGVDYDDEKEEGAEKEEDEESDDPDIPVVTQKRIEMSQAAFPLPDMYPLERMYANEINRIMAIDEVRAGMTKAEAFPSRQKLENDGYADEDEWYSAIFSSATAQKLLKVDDAEYKILGEQYNRPKGSLDNLKRPELRDITEPWGLFKKVRAQQVHQLRLDIFKEVAEPRQLMLKQQKDDRSGKANQTQKTKQREAAQTARKASDKRTTRDLLVLQLKAAKKAKDEALATQLQGQIDALDGEINTLKQAEKKALEEADYALSQAKEKEREEALAATLEELKAKITDEAIEVSAASLMLDRTRRKLQNDFDKARKFLTAKDLELIPDQPIDTRTRQDGQGDTEEDPTKAEDAWEIAGTLFSFDQHEKFFLTEAGKARQEAAWADFDEVMSDAVMSDAGSVAAAPIQSTFRLPAGHFKGTLPSLCELNMVRGGADIGVSASGKSVADAEDTLGEKALTSGNPLTAKELAKAPVLIFNTPYARHVLREHLLSLKRMHERAAAANPKAKFANVAESCGMFPLTGSDEYNPDVDAVVEKLLPMFENMLRYRNMMLGAKRMINADEGLLVKGLESLTIDKQRAHADKVRRIAQTRSRLVALGQLRGAFIVDARRMLTAEAGRVPGQLYMPQPYILPLRIAAPPRVGKSATALLVASLAKRIGMVTCYSVAPNKTVPLMELQKKLQRIGWRNYHSGAKDGKYVVSAANGGVYDAAVQAENLYATGTVVREKEAGNMRYAAFSIDSIPQQFGESPYRYGSSSNRLETYIDMIMYSAQTLEDPMRMGAVLAKWSRSDAVVFHLRDEAQVLAKAEKNPLVASHKIDTPPPPELQYLRAYYGNRYGLNCNITATHFPTLLEEDLWGYYGSVGQNIRAGMRADVGFSAIQKKPGAKFLPLLCPALQPYLPPGYVGIGRMKVWIPSDRNQLSGDPRLLEVAGANYRASRKAKAGGELFDYEQYIEQPGAETPPEAAAAAASSKPAPPPPPPPKAKAAPKQVAPRRMSTRDSRPPPKYGADDNRTEKEKARDTAKATAINRDLKLAEIYTGRKLADGVVERASQRTTRSKSAAAPDDGRKRKGAVAQVVEQQEKKEKKKKKQPSPVQPLQNKDLDGSPPDTLYEVSGSEESDDSDYEVEDENDADVALRDLATIDVHFKEWLEAGKQETIPPVSPVDPEDRMKQTLVPMYIGALNNNIGDDGMVSFVRLFSEVAHQRYLNYVAGKRNGGDGYVPTPSDDTLFGVAFVLFTTALENRAAVEKSNVALSNVAGEPLKFLPTPPKPYVRGTPVTSPLPASEYKLNEIDFADGTPKLSRAAICFVYRPTENAGVTLQPDATGKADPVRLYAFFCSSAASAVEHLDSLDSVTPASTRKGVVDKIAVLGYGMLTAGLTVQTYIKSKRKMFCPQYMALASTDQAALDGQLQIAGRSFVDLKAQTAPPTWQIQMLGVKGKLSKLYNYSLMEERLATVGDDGNQKPMFEVLKRGFKTRFIDMDSFSSLGYIGVRRGEFAQILGLTPESAKELVSDVQKVKQMGLTEEQADAKLEQALDAKEAPPSAPPAAAAASGAPGPSSAGVVP